MGIFSGLSLAKSRTCKALYGIVTVRRKTCIRGDGSEIYRVQQDAIRELKLLLASDKDRGVYYQFARLYCRARDTADATAALEKMKVLQQNVPS
jgi:hypothetical protein